MCQTEDPKHGGNVQIEEDQGPLRFTNDGPVPINL